MLHIILLILKIIGTLLLVLIGLLILIVLTVLLVPIRYCINVEHGEEYIHLEGRVSWLLHLIHARISMKDVRPHIRVRVLGIILYDNLKEKIIKPKKIKKYKSHRKNDVRTVKKMKTGKPVRSIKPDIKRKAEKENILKRENDNINEMISRHETIRETEEIKKNEVKEQSVKNLIREVPPAENLLDIKDNKSSDEAKEPRKSIFNRIFTKVKNFKNKIATFFHELKDKIKKWFEVSVNIKQKIRLILDFVKDQLNREVFKLTYSSLIKLLKHILPKKLRSTIVFGTGDPCTTGQALGAFGILYSFYGDKVKITPDFENKRFEGNHYAKGRIRLVTILIIVIKLIIDKRFKQFRINLKTLKEAL